MLDLFAGSGSMSYEAISRGMSHALLNDHSKAAIGIIKKNVKQFQMEQQCTIWNLDYAQALLRCHEEGRQFDLIFVDPPYALGKMEEIITLIDAYELLKDDGVLVVESLKEDQFAKQFGSLYQEKEAVYGISRMRYYRKGGNVDDRISGDI